MVVHVFIPALGKQKQEDLSVNLRPFWSTRVPGLPGLPNERRKKRRRKSYSDNYNEVPNHTWSVTSITSPQLRHKEHLLKGGCVEIL